MRAQLPLLEIDGLKIVQSGAIIRYIARKHGLEGGSAEEKMRADVVGRLWNSPFSFYVVSADFVAHIPWNYTFGLFSWMQRS